MKTRVFALIAAILFAGTAHAQSNVETENGDTVTLRALDIITGIVQDFDVRVGDTLTYERLKIRVDECRYPVANPSADAFAYLVIHDIREESPRFDGWMIASSPALSAMDHPRYDVWVLTCKTSDGETDNG